MTDALPAAPEAERSLVGACLQSTEALRIAATITGPGDFHNLSLGYVFAALTDLDADGIKPEPVAAVDLLRTRGLLERAGGIVGLNELIIEAAAVSNTRHTAAIVADKAALRRLLHTLENLKAECMANAPAADVLDLARRSLDEIDAPADDTLPAGAMSLDDWHARERESSPWVVPGLLRQGWRAIFVAPEGSGKSYLTSQIAVAAAHGMHPFGFIEIPPVRTLIIDAENPADVIDQRAARMISQAKRVRQDAYREHGCWIWSQPGGIDLRTRRDLGRTEAVLRHVLPSVVVLGPLYKVYRKKAGEEHEEAAVETQHVLDDLRTRYGFALVIEAHAPHGTSPATRDLRVRNSVAWQGWPEFGFGLRPNPDTGVLTVERFRGDRATAWWPDSFTRTKAWPWRGDWANDDWKAEWHQVGAA